MNRARTAANKMLGNGWFTSRSLSSLMGISHFEAAQAIQSVRRSPYYETEEEIKAGLVHVKVTAVDGHSVLTAKNNDVLHTAPLGAPV